MSSPRKKRFHAIVPPSPKSSSRVHIVSATAQNGFSMVLTPASRPQPTPPVTVKSRATVLLADEVLGRVDPGAEEVAEAERQRRLPARRARSAAEAAGRSCGRTGPLRRSLGRSQSLIVGVAQRARHPRQDLEAEVAPRRVAEGRSSSTVICPSGCTIAPGMSMRPLSAVEIDARPLGLLRGGGACRAPAQRPSPAGQLPRAGVFAPSHLPRPPVRAVLPAFAHAWRKGRANASVDSRRDALFRGAVAHPPAASTAARPAR